MTHLAPTPPRERAVSLDILRGFAMLGVLIGNMSLYTGSFMARGESSTADELGHLFIQIFVDSKAQTLLCFLFGFGFAAQLLRAQARREPVLGLYLRRMLVLFAFGASHVLLLWWGDVTWTYAVAGFGLLAFQHASNRVRVIVGSIFVIVPVLVCQIPEVRDWQLGVFTTRTDLMLAFKELGATIQNADREGLWRSHLHIALMWETQIWLWYFLWILGRFLLGYVAGAKRWFERDGADHLPVFRRMLWIGIVSTIAWGALLCVLHFGHVEQPLALRFVVQAVFQLSLIGTALGYVGAVVLAVQRPRLKRALSIIAPAGRMPLTTYILESVIATSICYGWGLGWNGIGPSEYIPLSLAIFAGEVALAHVWLRYFRFGPLEWLWRWGVYLERPRMWIDRSAATSAAGSARAE